MDQAKMDWRRLDPEKVRAGLQVVARRLGVSVRSPRGLPDEEMLAALEPYCTFAEVALLCGAFEYPQTDTPTRVQVIDVMIDFLLALGQATPRDEIKLRTELVKILPPDEAAALRSPS